MAHSPPKATGPAGCRRKFLAQFPGGFSDETYLAWERDYKWKAHRRWRSDIGRQAEFRARLDAGRHDEISAAAVRIEAGQPLLFSFEKMALKDAVVRSQVGAVRFADGLYDWLHGPGGEHERLERWLDVNLLGSPCVFTTIRSLRVYSTSLESRSSSKWWTKLM